MTFQFVTYIRCINKVSMFFYDDTGECRARGLKIVEPVFPIVMLVIPGMLLLINRLLDMKPEPLNGTQNDLFVLE